MNTLDDQIRNSLHGDGFDQGGYPPSVAAIRARKDAYRRRRQTRTGVVTMAGLFAVIGLAITLVPDNDDQGQGLQTQPDGNGSVAPPPDAGVPAVSVPGAILAIETISDLGDPIRQRLVRLDTATENSATLYEPPEARVISSLSVDREFVYFIESPPFADPEEGCSWQDSVVKRVALDRDFEQVVGLGIDVAIAPDSSVLAIVDMCAGELTISIDETLHRVALGESIIGGLHVSADSSRLYYSHINRSTPATFALDLADIPAELAEVTAVAFGQSSNVVAPGGPLLGVTYVSTASGPQASQRLRFDTAEGTPIGEPVGELIQVLDGDSVGGWVLEQRTGFGTEIGAGVLYYYRAGQPDQATKIPHGGFDDAIWLRTP